ncbi:MAG TPA: hypothetical protein VN310_00340 [Candidatus Dormibacteraeota bacterium]|nr:hypothetical protein [Candidatus Dormibacteraeota bacterium]
MVVFIVPAHGDYVVIGAESRNVDFHLNVLDDHTCKIISLGGDTLFYETGDSIIGVAGRRLWDSKAVARAVYNSSQKRDTLTLSTIWVTRAYNWFHAEPEQRLQVEAAADESIVIGGFINFDATGTASIHFAKLSYDAARGDLPPQPSSTGLGVVGSAGVGADLVAEFVAGKTPRALKAIGRPMGMKRQIGVDSTEDIENVKKAINFVMNNLPSDERKVLGGPIDIAVIRNDGTIRWINRKPSCSKEDKKPAPQSHKHQTPKQQGH